MDECEGGKDRIVDSPVQRTKPEPVKEPETKPEAKSNKVDMMFTCEGCGEVLKPYMGKDGKEVGVRRHFVASQNKFGKCLCMNCINKIKGANEDE
jgi:hypothetical protein